MESKWDPMEKWEHEREIFEQKKNRIKICSKVYIICGLIVLIFAAALIALAKTTENCYGDIENNGKLCRNWFFIDWNHYNWKTKRKLFHILDYHNLSYQRQNKIKFYATSVGDFGWSKTLWSQITDELTKIIHFQRHFVKTIILLIKIWKKIWNLGSNCSDPLEGGGTIYSNGFFCSVNFCRSICSSLWVETGIIRKLVQRRIWN